MPARTTPSGAVVVTGVSSVASSDGAGVASSSSVGSGAGTVVSGVDDSVVGGSVAGSGLLVDGRRLLGRCRVGLVRRRRDLVGLGAARGRHGHGADGSGDHGRPDEVGETVGTHWGYSG